MKKINARFASTCAETGKRIAKGASMVYDYSTKKCYSVDSKVYAAFESTKVDESTAGMIQANEEASFDNFCQQNNL